MKTRRDRLTEIKRGVEALLATLNENATTCDACGMAHYSAWDEFQAGKTLRSIAAKLERLAGQEWANQEVTDERGGR